MVLKMQYVDWEEMKAKNEPEFNKVIKTCELFGLTDIMSSDIIGMRKC